MLFHVRQALITELYISSPLLALYVEIASHQVAQADLEFTLQPKQAVNLKSSCLGLWSS